VEIDELVVRSLTLPPADGENGPSA
jgi:hypothetical protein